jgi:hypothetical protein
LLNVNEETCRVARDRFLKLCKDASGNTSIMFSFGMMALLAVAGSAVDYNRVVDSRASAEAALDAAVLAVAASDEKTVAGIQTLGETVFTRNYANGAFDVTSLSFQRTSTGTILGQMNGSIDTGLMHVFGYAKAEIDATAEATRGVQQACVILKNATAPQALLANSGADVILNGCAIHGHSQANPAAIFNSGSSLSGADVCLAGAQVINNGGQVDSLSLNCAARPDPYAGAIPEPASAVCDHSGQVYSGQVTLDPGVYCNGANFNASPDVNLRPGLYVIKDGDWNVDGGTWTGSGVTFYFEDSSKIQFNSGVESSLSAPASGPYAGVLFAEKEGLSGSQFIFNDDQGFEMEGLLYLPSRQVIFNSGGSHSNQSFSAVFDTLILNGVNWTMSPASASNSTDVVLIR